jgi:ubiquinol oxidase
MAMSGFNEQEALNETLNDSAALAEYRAAYDGYRVRWFPRVAGSGLVFMGNLFYGKKPSYLKFRAIEIVARVPYHSWESAVYTLLTLFFTDEMKAMRLAKTTRFSRHAQDNETMHVVVISKLARAEEGGGFIRCTLIPMLFAFIYFWLLYWLYFISRRQSLELNYVFENHAFEQYDEFLRLYEDELRKKSVESEFLAWYGRNPRNQYEFFQSVRNDELIHRNTSITEIGSHGIV